jgi:hypothetical protein
LPSGNQKRFYRDPNGSASEIRMRRGTCVVGGKAAAEAAVTHGAVRCIAWLGLCTQIGNKADNFLLRPLFISLATIFG